MVPSPGLKISIQAFLEQKNLPLMSSRERGVYNGARISGERSCGVATGLETLLEALSRIPGLGFLEKHAQKATTMRAQVRSHRERAEEMQQRAKDVKEAASPGGTPAQKKQRELKRQQKSEAAGQSIRENRRSMGEQDISPGPRVRSRGAVTPEQPKRMRDNSPDRDKGRSLRKRKEEF